MVISWERAFLLTFRLCCVILDAVLSICAPILFDVLICGIRLYRLFIYFVTLSSDTIYRSVSPRVLCFYLVCVFFCNFSLPLGIINELPHDKTNKIACAPSEDSDQF